MGADRDHKSMVPIIEHRHTLGGHKEALRYRLHIGDSWGEVRGEVISSHFFAPTFLQVTFVFPVIHIIVTFMFHVNNKRNIHVTIYKSNKKEVST